MGASRRFTLLLVLAAAILSILFLTSLRDSNGSGSPATVVPAHLEPADSSILSGHAIAPKLGNATAKAELGRAAWKVLHTTFARFPVKPTKDESEALRQYVHLFQRLYPCGECAEHFGKVLAKYPPQVSSRSAAATWGCYVHNIVNKRLHKPEYDCEQIGDAYDCGCADDEKQDSAEKPVSSEQKKQAPVHQ
ncbi:FAD-linked sulfhydryl oxidase-like protein ERV2 [Mytilinidion resinicola]|uniref:Sulfhydryl oxidase n=1 Tax=Mytilinidion resinicola TaxID=574789 RepID=A0A6A6YNP1_9PEZI|nr:FAD-linked sulfhydryl oxidase-like protein ERV2 [Mytilinidion resinicola]KAF2810179.1 FAD-linked sulfhydryl oxidase-like protein ERV2 [Mytilinidion resinicola]